MNRRSLMKFTGLASVATLLSGCFGNSVTRRVKYIVMAEVDGKPVEGSSVMEFTWQAESESGIHGSELGEAVVLELAGKGTVFMLPGRHNSDGTFNHGGVNDQVEYLISTSRSIRQTDFAAMEALTGRHPYFRWGTQGFPLMVAFKDEKRFRSIYEVKPDDFPRFFGSGVKFKGIDIEFTDEPVTRVLQERLPVLTGPFEGIPKNIAFDSQGKRRPPGDLSFEWNVGPKDFTLKGAR